MKRFNKKGFTLIELLAVVTIMGVLAMIAVPIVSKYINKSKTDSFVYTVKQYTKAVDDAYLLDKLECGPDGVSPIDASYGSAFQVLFNTDESKSGEANYWAYNNYKKLIKDGGKSPFGDANLHGYVLILIGSDDYVMQVCAKDEKHNGVSSPVDPSKLTASNITRTSTKNSIYALDPSGNMYPVCKVK